MLYAAVERLEAIDAAAVAAVAADMASDSPTVSHRPERVKAVPTAPTVQGVNESVLERRVAELETRLEEQERALRRVLTLLVDWVENTDRAPSYRTNAA
jgi:hypothetical protein